MIIKIGILHTALSCFVSLYAFIFPKNWFDYVYIFYTFFVTITWTICNGECIITYLVKRESNINYIPGKNINDNSDMYIFSTTPETLNMILNLLMIFWWYGIYITFRRNKYPNELALFFVNTWIVYKFLLLTYKNHHKNIEFQTYQKFILYILIILLLTTIYYTK